MIDFEQLRFEHPEILKGLWALPLVLLLLLVRRRAEPIVVPWLPLWDRVLATQRREFRILRQVLSILLKIIALALVIAALARPYREYGEPPRRETVIFLDRSPGVTSRVGSETLWDRVLRRAEEIRQVAARDGDVRLVESAEGFQDSAMLGRFVRAAPTVRCVVVTPFEIGAGAPESVLVASAAGVELPPIGGIRSVSLSREGLLVDVETASPRELQLEDGGEVRARMAVAKSGSMLLALPPSVGENPRLRLDPPDAWPDDDVAELTLPRESLVSVLVVSSVKTPHLDAALASTGLLDAAKSHRVNSSDEARSAGVHDLTIFVSEPLGTDLPEGALVTFGSPLRADDLWGTNRGVAVKSETAWLAALDPAEWVASKSLRWPAKGDWQVLVSGESGPLVIRYSRDDRTVIAFAVSPDTVASTLPRLPAFPIMIRGILAELQVPRGAGQVLAGPVVRGGPTASPARNSVWPTAPEGRARESLLSPLLTLIAGILLLDSLFGEFWGADR